MISQTIRLTGMCLLVAFPAFLAPEALSNQDRFKEIPPSLQLFEKESPANALWPSPEDIKQKRVPEDEVPEEQRVGSANYIRMKLHSKWLPDNLEDRLIPLRRLDGKNDYFIVRYQVDYWLLQIKDGRDLYFTVRPVKPGSVSDDIESYVLRTVEAFITPSKRSQNFKPWGQAKRIGTNLYRGTLLPEREHKRHHKSKPPSSIDWASNGQAVCFCVGKPSDYLRGSNLDSCLGKINSLRRKKNEEIGHKKFGLTPEEKDIANKYDELIRELENSPENPHGRPGYGKEQPKKPEKTNVGSDKHEPESQEGAHWLVRGLIIAALVLAGVVILLLLRRRK